jgi:hypothetical protein
MTETTSAVRVAPAAEGAALTEHVNVLMTPDMRAFLLGSKIIDQARSEGGVARSLLADAIESFRLAAPEQFAERVKRGRDELDRRPASAA